MQTRANDHIKTNGKSSSKHAMRGLDEAMDLGGDLLGDVEEFTHSEKNMLGDEVGQVKKVFGFVRSHWKTVLPAVAAIGLGAYVVRAKMHKGPATH
jgi:hypothetical protein